MRFVRFRTRRRTRLASRAAERALRTLFYRFRYGDAAPRAFELLTVDPDRIQHVVYPSLHYFFDHVHLWNTYVEGGDWDRRYRDEVVFTRNAENASVTELTNWIFYRSMLDHFADGVPWTDTDWYRRVASEGGLDHQVDYGDVERMEERLAETDELYEFVEADGYKRQATLRDDDAAPFETTRAPDPEYHEIVVNVGRDGELIFEEGRHRLAVVKALDVECIPVRVLVRHERWQELRHEVATATDPSDLSERARAHLDHPDVRPIVPDWASRRQ